MSAVIFLNSRFALNVDAAPAKFLAGYEEIDNRIRQPFLVVLDGDLIITTLINDGCGYVGLATKVSNRPLNFPLTPPATEL